MKRLSVCLALIAMAGCDGALPMGGAGGGMATSGGGGGFREYLVLGSKMSFEQCRAKGGLIIRDAGSPQVACDPRVIGPVVPADEFNHPGAPVGANATAG